MTTFKQGDIVASNGRIATQQDGRRRYIEFEGALVLEVDGKLITVNPLGMKARLVAQADDLHIGKSLSPRVEPGTPPEVIQRTTTKAPPAKPAPDVNLAGHVVESTAVAKRPKPKLSALRPTQKAGEDKPAPKRRPTTKPPARRRKPR